MRKGITLLEIIFSIVILAMSMTALANLSRMGMRNAVSARDMAQAQFLCESLLTEIQTGVLTLEAVFDEPVLDFPDTGATNPYDSNEALWHYSVDINTIHDYGLIEVKVTVTKNELNVSKPFFYQLIRWMVDGDVVQEILAERENSTTTTGEGSSSSATSAPSGGGTP